MTPVRFRFDPFVLDPDERLLTRDGAPVDMNGRYLDALVLLVREPGRLITKERFFAEVWRGVPVTDEALTQCIRTLRRQLGDNAAAPVFIETVPKHGYRFVAAVETAADEPGDEPGDEPDRDPTAAPAHAAHRAGAPLSDAVTVGLAAMMGAGTAGLVGGLFYGFVAAGRMTAPDTGAVSALIVLALVTVFVALLGGAGVGAGLAAASRLAGPTAPWRWAVPGGALGGMLVGAVVKLLGLDAFHLLLGRAPGDITGAAEGLALGGAVGLGAWLAGRLGGWRRLRTGVAVASLCGAAAGAAIPALGGRLMGGSLDLLAGMFPGSRLRLDRIGTILGEPGFGPVSQILTGALEGALFASCVVGAVILARCRRDSRA